jgi:hypothetical protein
MLDWLWIVLAAVAVAGLLSVEILPPKVPPVEWAALSD